MTIPKPKPHVASSAASAPDLAPAKTLEAATHPTATQGPVTASEAMVVVDLGLVEPGTRIGDPCVAGAKRFPVVDRKGVAICVGDTIRAQVCVGRYGAVKAVEMVVHKGHWELGSLPHAEDSRVSVNTSYDSANRRQICSTRNDDFEHGHETWAEVIRKCPPEEVGQPFVLPGVMVPVAFSDAIYHWGAAARRSATPDDVPGMTKEERSLVRMLCEADHVRTLSASANDGYPALADQVTDGMVKRGRDAEAARATFRHRWGMGEIEALRAYDAVYRGHPLVIRFVDWKRGES